MYPNSRWSRACSNVLATVEPRCKKNKQCSDDELSAVSLVDLPGVSGTYISSSFEMKEEEARKRTQHHADASGKVLRDIVGIEDTKSRDNSSKSLKADRGENNPVVTVKKAILSQSLPIEEKNPNK